MAKNKFPKPENQPEKPRGGKKESPGSGKPKFNFYWIYIVLIGVFLLTLLFPSNFAKETSWEEVKEMAQKGHVQKFLVVTNSDLIEVFIKQDSLKHYELKEVPFYNTKEGPHYQFYYAPDAFREELKELKEQAAGADQVPVVYEPRQEWDSLLIYLLPIAIFVGIWIFIMRRLSGGGGGGQLFNIGKSKATLFEKDSKVSVNFDDVAGLDEAKQEVMEVVDFLKSPGKYTKLGGKIPKGVLLVGPPGTGKTLLAKAVAGEAGVPFFSLSGSDFVEMFVGVGASRVRDLFRQAKEKAPCIIFIDEIDAIGRARGKNMMTGGNDERENTLNQLLTEMDGFSTNSGVIIMAATNRPDVLDTALMRPGRFDRQVSVDRPDIVGREQIFKVHLRPIRVTEDVDPRKLAAQTPGFAGAEIANVCNEAALIAARKNKEKVDMSDFQDAIDRVIGGLEKKNKIISPEEKKIIAFHEAGHAVVGWFLEHAAPLLKVSIVPRGVAALGYAQYLPKEQYLYTKEQLIDTICMALGGRVAEDITFGRVSTGAQNDLERITKLSYSMVTLYGMTESVGQVSYHDAQGEYGFGKPYSERTAELIDIEVRKLISEAYDRTRVLLKEKREELIKIAEALLDKEIIFREDLTRLLGERPFEPKHHPYEDYMRDNKLEGIKPAASGNGIESGTSKKVHKKDEQPQEAGSEIKGQGHSPKEPE